MSFEHIAVPQDGERVRYNPETDSFPNTENPIIPFAYGDTVGESTIPAAKRVLDAAATEMGRDIGWMRVFAGADAVQMYGTPLPEETVTAFKRFRLGLIGPFSRTSRRNVAGEIRNQLDLSVEVRPISHLRWTPTSVSTRDELDIVCFRDITEDSEAGLEFEHGSGGAKHIREYLEVEDERFPLPNGPAGFGVRPITQTATERLIKRAIEYAFDRDRDRLTIAHRGDKHPATEGGFRTWAWDFLDREYSDGIVTEATFDAEFDGYPQDEVVAAERYTDEVARDLFTTPDEYDVLVAPAAAGAHISTIASEIIGGAGVTPSIAVGGGQVLAGQIDLRQPTDSGGDSNPIALIRAGCHLLELLGWEDTVGTVRDAIEATLSDGLITRDLATRTARGELVPTGEFTDRIVEHIQTPAVPTRIGGVRTTAEERYSIRMMIAGLYNILFEDQFVPEDIELNQLRNPDDEADIYLPEVGINFRYWRRWSVERRLEVLLHEFAHVEDYDDGHAPSFYDRLVELTNLAEDWQSEIEVLFDDTIDFSLVKRLIVESVHEETVEPDIESVRNRRRRLREQLGISSQSHY